MRSPKDFPEGIHGCFAPANSIWPCGPQRIGSPSGPSCGILGPRGPRPLRAACRSAAHDLPQTLSPISSTSSRYPLASSLDPCFSGAGSSGIPIPFRNEGIWRPPRRVPAHCERRPPTGLRREPFALPGRLVQSIRAGSRIATSRPRGTAASSVRRRPRWALRLGNGSMASSRQPWYRSARMRDSGGKR